MEWACTTQTRAVEIDGDLDGSRAVWACTTQTRTGETARVCRACRLQADEDVDGSRAAWVW
jgi:hypothetical protein